MVIMTVKDIIDSLSKLQRRDLYYVVGYALDNGAKKARNLIKYKDLVKSLDDIQKKALEDLIDAACKEKENCK